MKLRIGLPKGSLQESTIRMMKKAGYPVLLQGRSYHVEMDDPELEGMMFRAQEIPRYVSEGVLDCGIAGKDLIEESEADVVDIAELGYSKATLRRPRIVLAVHKDSGIQTVEDLKGKRIAAELVNVTRKFLARHQVEAKVEFSWGATEIKVPELADAIVDLTETGSSLHAHGLRILAEIMETSTRFMANQNAWNDPWKRSKIDTVITLLLGAIAAEGKVGLKMNAPRNAVEKITSILPALKQPTVSNLTDESWVALETIIDENVVREIIPKLKACGATGIIEYPLNKVIP